MFLIATDKREEVRKEYGHLIGDRFISNNKGMKGHERLVNFS